MLSVHGAKAIGPRSVGRRAVAAAYGCGAAAGQAEKKDPDPVLCRDCVHFRSQLGRTEFGKCHHRGEVNLVTGEKTFMFASVAREHTCMGEHFERMPGMPWMSWMSWMPWMPWMRRMR